MGQLPPTPFQQGKAHDTREALASGGNQWQGTNQTSQIQNESIPATPEQSQHASQDIPGLGGNSHQFGEESRQQLSEGNHDPAAQPSLHNDAATQRHALAQAALVQRSASMKRLGVLPSAEQIDALFDMDTPPASPIPVERLQHLPPIATRRDSLTQGSSAQLASSHGTQSGANRESYLPQHSGLQFKSGKLTQHRQHNVPETSLHGGSFRMQSECSSSACDEGNTSSLVHSASHEEGIIRELLEQGHDDVDYDVPNIDDLETGNDGSKAMNTQELHGILGQHGYKLPARLVSQPEEGGSDGDAEGDDEDEADDESDDGELDASDPFNASAENMFKVIVRLTCMLCTVSQPLFNPPVGCVVCCLHMSLLCVQSWCLVLLVPDCQALTRQAAWKYKRLLLDCSYTYLNIAASVDLFTMKFCCCC